MRLDPSSEYVRAMRIAVCGSTVGAELRPAVAEARRAA
jgi:hypothetical protein